MVFNCGCHCEEDKGDSFDSFDESIMTSRYEDEAGMDVLVTVPPGYQEGNVLLVKSPFGTRKAQVVIPSGIYSGQHFKVTLPHPAIEPRKAMSPTISAAVENFMSPVPTVVGQLVSAGSFAKLYSTSRESTFS